MKSRSAFPPVTGIQSWAIAVGNHTRPARIKSDGIDSLEILTDLAPLYYYGTNFISCCSTDFCRSWTLCRQKGASFDVTGILTGCGIMWGKVENGWRQQALGSL